MKRLSNRSNEIKVLLEGNKGKVMKGGKLLETVEFQRGENLVEAINTLKKDYLLEAIGDTTWNMSNDASSGSKIFTRVNDPRGGIRYISDELIIEVKQKKLYDSNSPVIATCYDNSGRKIAQIVYLNEYVGSMNIYRLLSNNPRTVDDIIRITTEVAKGKLRLF